MYKVCITNFENQNDKSRLISFIHLNFYFLAPLWWTSILYSKLIYDCSHVSTRFSTETGQLLFILVYEILAGHRIIYCGAMGKSTYAYPLLFIIALVSQSGKKIGILCNLYNSDSTGPLKIVLIFGNTNYRESNYTE